MGGPRVLVLALASLAACGTSYGAAEEAADGGPGPNGGDAIVVAGPAALDFGTVPCGTESTAKLLTIQNKGTGSVTYKLQLPEGSAFRVVGPLDAELVGGAVVTLQVFAKPGAAGTVATDLVLIAGSTLQTIPAKVGGTGAQLELLPPSVDFGDVRMQNGASEDVAVRNVGNAAIALSSFESSSDFAVTLDSKPLVLPPGAMGTIHAKLQPAALESPLLHVDLKAILPQPICGRPPSLALSGRRVNSDVTISSGDFGKQDCTAMPAARNVSITNYSPTALTYTSALAATSRFVIVSGATGAIAAGSSSTPSTAIVSVQPKPFGTTLGPIKEDVDVTISGLAPPAGGLRKLPLAVDVRGAVVTFAPTSITNFVSNGNNTDSKTFTMMNTGNELINLSWTSQVMSGSGSNWSYSVPSTVGPGETRTATVNFKAISPGSSSATLTATRGTDFFGGGGVSCTPLTPIMLKGARN